MKLEGKKALITGGATGIGRAIALAFAKEGADVAVNYLDSEKEALDLKAIIEKEYDRKVITIQADVSEVDQVKNMVEKALDDLGGIDILVNSAGINQQSTVEELSVEDWDRMMTINLRAPFLSTKFVLPHMLEKESGRIINISSQLGQIGSPENSSYSASKAGVIAFTKSLAREVSTKGINANCIAPGPIDTPFLSAYDEEWKAEQVKGLPLGRFGVPEEVAPTAVLLASEPDGNIYVGQTLGPNSGDVML